MHVSDSQLMILILKENIVPPITGHFSEGVWIPYTPNFSLLSFLFFFFMNLLLFPLCWNFSRSIKFTHYPFLHLLLHPPSPKCSYKWIMVSWLTISNGHSFIILLASQHSWLFLPFWRSLLLGLLDTELFQFLFLPFQQFLLILFCFQESVASGLKTRQILIAFTLHGI